MSNQLNIIQRRELEPLLLKAHKIVKHYEKAANCVSCVMKPDFYTAAFNFNLLCGKCGKGFPKEKKDCLLMHKKAIHEAKLQRGLYIYTCPADSVFWTSPFFSGKRFAGALISGGVYKMEKDSDKIKALAQMMHICAEQISRISFIQKNTHVRFISKKISQNNSSNTENDSYPIDMERMLFACLKRGDNVEAKRILSELLNTHNKKAKGNFQILRLRAIELLVLLSRAASDSGNISDTALLKENNHYLKKLEEVKTIKEAMEILYSVTDQMAARIFSFHGVCHFSAIRKAERYIWENYTKKISLQEIAAVAGLSASYFSTIFKEEMRENLSNYLNRLRTEKAAVMLITTNKSISWIAAACGFEDQSWFSKIFKTNTGFTPGKYREQRSLLG